MGPGFIHLTCKSNFSLLEGMIPVKKLAKKAGEMGLPAVGMTDIGNLFGAVEASRYFPENGVQPILGAEVPVLGLQNQLGVRQEVGFMTLLVQDEEGWKNLAQLISEANMRKYEHDEAGVALDKVLEHSAGLIAMSGPYGRGWSSLGRKQGLLNEALTPLAQAFGDRFYMQLQRQGGQAAQVVAGMNEAAFEAELRKLALQLNAPLVATNDTRFLKGADREAFDALVCIGDGTTLDDPARRKFPASHALRSPEDMVLAFRDVPDALTNTVEIAKRCAFLIPAVHVKKMFMPKWEFTEGKTVSEAITDEATAGLQTRMEQYVYPLCADDEAKAAAKERYEKQLKFELEVIIGMGYDGYFMITSDFIRWAKRHDIPVGPGRGSGAGSLVAWSLEITDLDPLRWDLYFERFLNPDRVSLPDFDIDFCQDRREEVIAYVQQRFGKDRVSQIITFGTLKARACFRDVGRVLGLSYGFVGQIAAFIPEVPNPPPISEVLQTDERLKARYDAEEDVKRLVDTALQLEGCYRHASTHAAGVIITDRPIAQVCGLYVDPRSSMPATQFNMKDVEHAGLVKFDFLGLKTLSIVRMAEKLVHNRPEDKAKNFEVARISLEDDTTFGMLRKGHTLGVFQIESAGMTDLTKKMQANDLESISALISLYRPGPMEWIPKYIACRLGQEEVQYPHPLLEDTLKVTFGIAVYQEQVMQMARVLAGYTLAGADLLRRAMGKKKPEEMAKERVKFVNGAQEVNGIEATTANSIFDQMSAFAGYGFNKAHSMAYSLISYQTAYLKAHYPLEFMAAVMTYDRGNTDKLLRYKSELEKMGFALHPASVNESQVMFSVEVGAVRHALAAIKGAGEEVMRLLVAEREANGKFKDLWDMLSRLDPHGMNKRQLEVLAKSGALDCFAPEDKFFRARVLANLDKLLAYGQACAEQKVSGQGGLFDGGGSTTPDATPYKQGMAATVEMDYLQRLSFEQETLGFYMSDHPLGAFKSELAKMRDLKPVSEIENFASMGGGFCKVAVMVHSIREVKTKSGGRMGILLVSDPAGQGEIAVFPEAYTAQQQLLEQSSENGQPLLITIKVSQDGERLRVNAENIRTLGEMLGERQELVIEVGSPSLLGAIKTALDKAEKGRTRVKLIVPAPGGRQAVIKVPQGISCSPSLMTNLRGLGVVG